jgi:hypothetical protein
MREENDAHGDEGGDSNAPDFCRELPLGSGLTLVYHWTTVGDAGVAVVLTMRWHRDRRCLGGASADRRRAGGGDRLGVVG